MNYNEAMKKKVLENKKQKENALLQAAFDLLVEQDVHSISVSDIVEKAGLAKGTFYLYFKDKYEIRDALIHRESLRMFQNAQEKLNLNDIRSFEDTVIFVINQVLLEMESRPEVMRFMERNLSVGLFHDRLENAISKDSMNMLESFTERAEKAGYHYDRPEVILYMIVELAGSTCYDAIVNGRPVDMNTFRPYLFNAIRAILNSSNQ